MTEAGYPVSESAALWVGEDVKVDGKAGGIIDVMGTGSIIKTLDGTEFPGVRFQVQYEDGTRGWTVTFPDREPEDAE